MVAATVDPGRLVFVDEMGTNTSLYPTHAYSKRGERAYASAPRNRGPNTTLLSSTTLRGMGPSMVVVGATTKVVFESHIQRLLAPSLKNGQIVVLDNLSAHKRERVRELVEARGCELFYLPPYSPDFNPIEEAFSKVKGILRKAEARTCEALIEALGVAISGVTPTDARGYFQHGGYRSVVHPLYETCCRILFIVMWDPSIRSLLDSPNIPYRSYPKRRPLRPTAGDVAG